MNLAPLAQQRAWSLLKQMSNPLPQGMVFLGPSGAGKRRSARALFQKIHCENLSRNSDPCGQCVSCRKIYSGNHPDFLEIRAQKDSIAVDDLREMKKILFFAPHEAKFRFIVLDEAHKLNVFSANTLLKALEEPPEHTRFILVTHEKALLLPTVLSRCQLIYFSPLDERTLQALLQEQGLEIPHPLLPWCLKLMGGGLERAAFLAEPKTLEFIETALKEIRSPSVRWDDVVGFADRLGTEDWKLGLFLDLFVAVQHENALLTQNKRELQLFSEHSLKAAHLKRRLDRHANKKLVALAAAELSGRH